MPSCHCDATDRHFTLARARDEMATYRRCGPTGTARLILRCLTDLSWPAKTLLDVGAGIGVLHHELLAHGVERAVHLEAAHAYLQVAGEESARRGHGALVTLRHGDLVSEEAALSPADLVTMDRVVCCYPDLEPLIRISAGKAVRYYALSYPHDLWYMRAHTRWQNAKRRRAGNAFRTFVHPVARIRSLVQEAGLLPVCMRRTLTWEVLLCSRAK